MVQYWSTIRTRKFPPQNYKLADDLSVVLLNFIQVNNSENQLSHHETNTAVLNEAYSYKWKLYMQFYSCFTKKPTVKYEWSKNIPHLSMLIRIAWCMPTRPWDVSTPSPSSSARLLIPAVAPSSTGSRASSSSIWLSSTTELSWLWQAASLAAASFFLCRAAYEIWELVTVCTVFITSILNLFDAQFQYFSLHSSTLALKILNKSVIDAEWQIIETSVDKPAVFFLLSVK